MNNKVLISIAIGLLIIIIIVVVMASNKNSSTNVTSTTSEVSNEITSPTEPYRRHYRKEGFFNAANGAYVDEKTGIIRGNNIFSDHMTVAKSPQDLLKEVKNNQYYAETGDLGAVINTDNINKLMANQVEINKINKDNTNGVMSEAELGLIDKKMKGSAGNQLGSMYNRAGAVLTELDVAPGRIIGVVDRDYIPDRDKSHRVYVTKAAVPVQGFDISMDRIPIQMSQGMFKKSSFAANKFSKNQTAKLPSEASMASEELVNYENQDKEGFKKITGGYLTKHNTRY